MGFFWGGSAHIWQCSSLMPGSAFTPGGTLGATWDAEDQTQVNMHKASTLPAALSALISILIYPINALEPFNQLCVSRKSCI